MIRPSHRTLTLLTAVLLAAMVVTACGGNAQPEPTATAAPVEVAPTPTEASPAGPIDLWQQIQKNGKMVVGVSADYPPFEFYDDKFQLDGFDIALMKEIGKELGVEIVFNDFAFDGLGGALTMGQIDAAISAISVTAKREELVDFSNVYYVGASAVLVGSSWQEGQISEAEDIGALRIGVQGGSVYESWARNELVAQDILPEENLHVYTDISQAVKDLEAGRIEAVLLDLAPAKEFEKQFDVKVVGEDLQEQDYAIALPLNQSALRRVLNRALSELESTGVVDKLAQLYLGVDPDDLLPVPTPEPTPAPDEPTATPAPTAPPTTCVDGMAWVADLTYDDKNMTAPPVVPAGQPFVKSWRVRNSGTCTWDSSYFLGFDRGNVPAAQMGGQPVAIKGTVAPNATYDISVDLVAPTVPGVYQGFWQMRNGSNTAFGETIWVGIRVPAPTQPTPTPGPTATPVPGITFVANPTTIQQGQCTTVSWSTTNVREVYYYQDGQDWQNHGVAGQDTRTECPQQTTTYFLRVVMNDNTVQTRQVTVNVTPVAGAPTISRFSMDPPSPITIGQCVTLQWSVQGTITNVRLLRNNGAVWESAPYQGSWQDCPPGAGQFTYLLQATGPGGTSQASQFLDVKSSQPTATPVPPTATPVPPTATPVPPTATPVPVPQPEIFSFSVQPGEIQQGQCVSVNWSTGGGAVSVDVARRTTIIVDNGPLSGSTNDCPAGPGGVDYTLTASNQAGTTVSQAVTINVVEAPPPTNTPVPAPVGSWSLTSMYGGSLIPGTSITANFNNGSLSGSGGCNSYNTSYSTNGNAISIGAPAAGQMACPDEVLQQESMYFSLLPTAATFQMSGPTLTLFDGSGRTILQYSGAR